MTSEVEYKCNNCGHEGMNTLAVPDVPELVRYGNYIDNRMHIKPTGEYVRYDQAAAVIAAKDAEIARLKPYENELLRLAETVGEEKDPFAAWEHLEPALERSEAAEAELAQIKAQVPVAVVRFDRSEGNENEMPKVVSCNWLPDGNYPLYAAPIDQTAEIERLNSATTDRMD